MAIDPQELAAIYTRALGRPPRQSEINFFTSLGADDDIDAFEAEQLLSGLPEAQEARLRSQGQEYQNLLAQSDAGVLDKAASVANSNFARMGRTGSSGQSSQIISAGRDLAMGRQSKLADFYNQGFGENRRQYQGQSSDSLQRAYMLGDRRNQYARQDFEYNRQQNDYNNMFKQQQSANLKNALIGGALGGLGQAAGGYFGGIGMAKGLLAKGGA